MEFLRHTREIGVPLAVISLAAVGLTACRNSQPDDNKHVPSTIHSSTVHVPSNPELISTETTATSTTATPSASESKLIPNHSGTKTIDPTCVRAAWREVKPSGTAPKMPSVDPSVPLGGSEPILPRAQEPESCVAK